MTISPEQRAHYARSVARARAVLKRGDRVRLSICGGGQATYTFEAWDGPHGAFVSRSGITDLHPYNIVRLNRLPISFRDEA